MAGKDGKCQKWENEWEEEESQPLSSVLLGQCVLTLRGTSLTQKTDQILLLWPSPPPRILIPSFCCRLPLNHLKAFFFCSKITKSSHGGTDWLPSSLILYLHPSTDGSFSFFPFPWMSNLLFASISSSLSFSPGCASPLWLLFQDQCKTLCWVQKFDFTSTVEGELFKWKVTGHSFSNSEYS